MPQNWRVCRAANSYEFVRIPTHFTPKYGNTKWLPCNTQWYLWPDIYVFVVFRQLSSLLNCIELWLYKPVCFSWTSTVEFQVLHAMKLSKKLSISSFTSNKMVKRTANVVMLHQLSLYNVFVPLNMLISSVYVIQNVVQISHFWSTDFTPKILIFNLPITNLRRKGLAALYSALILLGFVHWDHVWSPIRDTLSVP